METPVIAAPPQANVVDPGIYKMLEIKPQPVFPDRTAIVAQQNAERQAAEKAAAEAEAARQAEIAAEEAARPKPTVQPIYMNTAGDYLVSGSYGYAVPYGNCVDEPGVNNPGYGNPINWPVLSSSPWIGATVLFSYNHTGVVTGFWSNGDLEIRHRNFQGGIHRFPRSAFRGFR